MASGAAIGTGHTCEHESGCGQRSRRHGDVGRGGGDPALVLARPADHRSARPAAVRAAGADLRGGRMRRPGAAGRARARGAGAAGAAVSGLGAGVLRAVRLSRAVFPGARQCAAGRGEPDRLSLAAADRAVRRPAARRRAAHRASRRGRAGSVRRGADIASRCRPGGGQPGARGYRGAGLRAGLVGLLGRQPSICRAAKRGDRRHLRRGGAGRRRMCRAV